jgi:hypothetical protein
MKLRILAVLALALSLGATVNDAWGQSLLDGGLFGPEKNGLHIYNVTASVGYSSLLGAFSNANDLQGHGGNYYSSAGVSLGYSHSGAQLSVRVMYVPSYSGTYRYSSLNSFNQRLNLTLSRRLGFKWTFYVVAVGDDSTVEQFIFQPNTLTTFVNGPATFDELAGAVMGGATSASPLKTFSQILIYGTRVLSFGANAGMTYRPSTRLRISFNGSGNEAQARPDSRDLHPEQSLLPRTRSEAGDANISYTLNPRTEIGTQFSTTRTQSFVGDYQTSNFSGSIGRKVGMHWFASVQGGLGVFNSLGGGDTVGRSNQISPLEVSYLASGSVGYKGREHTWAGTYNRRVADQYGLGSESTTGLSGSWNWHQPGSSWAVYVSGGKQLLGGGLWGDLGSWQASAGVSRSLGRQVSCLVAYSYLKDSVSQTRMYNNVSAHAVRLTISWIPFLREAPPLTTAPANSGETSR